MCAVRCPVRVEVKDGRVTWIEGNPHVGGMEGSLCAKGAAAISFEYDSERVQTPLIRDGARGSGRWRKASWDEALDYIGEKLKATQAKYGKKSVALTDRGGLFTDLTKSFIKAIGSPNYFDHDDSCAKNVNIAVQSVYGYGRGETGYDYANAKHIVLVGRNLFEALNVKEVNNVLNGMEKGAKLTYVDIRATTTAAKADNFYRIRPGTDYAFLLGLIHEIIAKGYYDANFVAKNCDGFEELQAFVQPYSPEWAERECEISAANIRDLAAQVNAAKPKVIFHGGWMFARYRDSFYASRMLYILNALMGSVETKGGFTIAKGPGDCGRKGLQSLGKNIPEPQDKIVDAAMPGKTMGSGHIVNCYKAMRYGQPYPIKALICYRYDVMTSLPDPEGQKKYLDNLDLLVSIDVNYSDMAWYSDVILPEATYLERSNIICAQKGLKPQFAIRRQAIEPLYDAKPGWEIFTLLAEKMGVGQYFPYKSIEDMWRVQLEGTGVTLADFDGKGVVGLSKDAIFQDPDNLKFKTPSGKIEFVSQNLSKNGFESLKPYVSPNRPEAGHYRLVFGRSPAQAHAQSVNNLYLNEILPENHLWIHESEAMKMGVKSGDMLKITAPDGVYTGVMKAKVTPFIHPEAVFMLHGFGNDIPLKTRSFGRGLRDSKFETGMVEMVDPVGGGVAYLECFVKVEKA
jgi:thiosulfate reductase/polysulfide reductase chain A